MRGGKWGRGRGLWGTRRGFLGWGRREKGYRGRYRDYVRENQFHFHISFVVLKVH